jgi:hypothetical protein
MAAPAINNSGAGATPEPAARRRGIRLSRLVFLESRIASPVASIGGELEREAGGPTPLVCAEILIRFI